MTCMSTDCSSDYTQNQSQCAFSLLEQVFLPRTKCKTCDQAFAVLLNSLRVGICSATTPFLLLGDVLDCLPLDQCDKIFSFVEENVSTWKSVNRATVSQ